jgi:hypothetical protein
MILDNLGEKLIELKLIDGIPVNIPIGVPFYI